MPHLLRPFITCWLEHKPFHRTITSQIRKHVRPGHDRFQIDNVVCQDCELRWRTRREIVNDKLEVVQHRTPLHALPEVAWTGDAISALGLVAE